MIRRIALALCAPAMLGAQSGGWVVVPEKYRDARLNAMVAHMTDFMTVLRRDAYINQPTGYTVQAKLMAAQSSPAKMVTGRLSALLIAGTTTHGEGLGFNVIANNIGCALGESAHMKDADGGFYTPVPSKTVHGFPMYGEPGCIVITKRTAAPTIPVTRERAARALLEEHAGEERVVAEINRELAAMSAQERAAPAIVDIARITAMQLGEKPSGPLLAKAEGEGTIRLVAANPAFYDRTRLGDVQALSIGFDCLDGRGSQWCAGFKGVFERIRDNIDWDALARLVTP